MSKSGSEATLNSAIDVPVIGTITRPSEQKTSKEKQSPAWQDAVNEVDKEGVNKLNENIIRDLGFNSLKDKKPDVQVPTVLTTAPSLASKSALKLHNDAIKKKSKTNFAADTKDNELGKFYWNRIRLKTQLQMKKMKRVEQKSYSGLGDNHAVVVKFDWR